MPPPALSILFLYPNLPAVGRLYRLRRRKVMKPDPAIFQLLCERYHLIPEECFFIDDRLENIEAASNLGMAVHQYQMDAMLYKIRCAKQRIFEIVHRSMRRENERTRRIFAA
ncbi:MAG: HAD-IA family hydrolase [Anaeromassilibacillus sp.]